MNLSIFLMILFSFTSVAHQAQMFFDVPLPQSGNMTEEETAASRTCRQLDLLEDFTRLEGIPLDDDEDKSGLKYMSRWKQVSLRSQQRDTVEQYEQLWSKLEILMPTQHLNWISDQFK